jgi:ABC-type sugar transport system substrate-binding protein
VITGRRTGTAVAWAVLAALCLAGPAPAGAQGSEALSTPAAVKHDAHTIGDTVKRDSKHFAQQVSKGAREFQVAVKQWWSRVKPGADHPDHAAH